MAMRQAGEDEKVCDSFAAELEGWISHILKRKIKFGKTKIRKTEEYSATPAAFVQKFLVRKNEFHIYFLIRNFPNIFIYVPQIFISSQIVNFSLFPSEKKNENIFLILSFLLFFFSFQAENPPPTGPKSKKEEEKFNALMNDAILNSSVNDTWKRNSISLEKTKRFSMLKAMI